MNVTDIMHNPLTSEQLAKVDAHILAGSLLPAIITIREVTGLGIKDAIDIHLERYRELRESRPGDFSCTDEDYWREVYS